MQPVPSSARILLAVALALAATVLLCSPAQARRSRVERKPLYTQPLLQPAPVTDAPRLPEMLSAEDCAALAPPGFALELERPDPSRFMQGGGLTLEPRGSSLLVRLSLKGQPAEDSAPVWSDNADQWGEQRRLFPSYSCSVNLRACPPSDLDRLLQSFDSAAHNAYLRSLESPLPSQAKAKLGSGLQTGLDIAGNDKLSRGREYLAWDCPLGSELDAQSASAIRGELQALIRADGRYYILNAHFTSEALEDAPALTRNLAACAASHLTGQGFTAWDYQSPPDSPASKRPAQAVERPVQHSELQATQSIVGQDGMQPKETGSGESGELGLQEIAQPRTEEPFTLPPAPEDEESSWGTVPKSSGDLWAES